MNTKYLFLLLLFPITVSLCFQGCDQPITSDSKTDEATEIDEAEKDESNNIPETKEKPHSELTPQEYSDFVAKHADHLKSVDKKFVSIKNQNVQYKDQFVFECADGEAHLERLYNDNKEVHLLSLTNCKGDDCSVKHHYFEGGKLIYQFFHHEVKDGDKFVVDDHRTFFKDGKMLKCLEKRYSYTNGEAQPNVPYKLVDCHPDQKLTGNIEKLLTMSEEEAKSFLCK